ncbi:MAG: thiolase family protein [Oceanicaulis sp.]|nr:thiolase family protein [Oceanicaulis sp.]
MTALGKHEARSIKDLVREAVTAALTDAGVATGQIEAALFSNTRQPILEGQNAVRGQIALAPLGLDTIPIVNVENACASGSSAVAMGADMIRAGRAQTVLVVGAEKMVYRDRDELVMKAFRGGTDVERIDETAARMAACGAALLPERYTPAPRRSFFMDIYAGLARLHMERFGTTPEQIAYAAAKNHTNAVRNPRAQYGGETSPAQVLADKPVVWPLTRLMCAPISDGAAALVLRPAREAGRRGVTLAGTAGPALRTGRWRITTIIWAAAPRSKPMRRRALGQKRSISPKCTTPQASPNFFRLKIWGCVRAVKAGRSPLPATARNGRIPVNVSGGLVAKGHPVGATGVVQICELVEQLRGEAGALQVKGARVAVAENAGGFLGVEEAATLVTVLTR